MPSRIPPLQFETTVKKLVDIEGQHLVDYESSLRDSVEGSDGEYEIDIRASFTALGSRITVIIECKAHRRKVEREDVMVLRERLLSLGANKAMLFSISGYQSGAIAFARQHGISLHWVDGDKSSVVVKSMSAPRPLPPWIRANEPDVWRIDTANDGAERRTLVTQIQLGS